MFVVTDQHSFERTVTVKMPSSERPDAIVEQSFRMTFLAVDQDEARRWDDEQAARSPEERRAHEHDFLVQVAKGWADIVDAGQQPIPFSGQALRQLLKRAWFERAVYEAYRAGMAAEPRLGN
ncbi:MAG: hypothetical protein J0J10_23130 [Bosea sp.]|uniref:hypothetical protein n=1 Tax=Bosea sp. (in: a-proteobacteria) TaxID=1871050 RepID=UPI001ACCF4A2|nr:hypothetical protein [Bosea sp. (in: a-proteobacteria)]MBN9471666.1 hypothetical protein [Bosea sp. (in: a-proteobacteria)]